MVTLVRDLKLSGIEIMIQLRSFDPWMDYLTGDIYDIIVNIDISSPMMHSRNIAAHQACWSSDVETTEKPTISIHPFTMKIQTIVSN